jgi:hypothetical protein
MSRRKSLSVIDDDERIIRFDPAFVRPSEWAVECKVIPFKR